LIEAEFPRRVERDRQVLTGLDEDERAQLTALLKRISLNIDSGIWD